MKEEQRDELRKTLETRADELKEIILDSEEVFRSQITDDGSGESRIDYNHPADMLSADPDYEKGLTLIKRQRAELAMVEEALQRLDAGNFGACEACGEEIDMERLLALPYTRYCVACQEIRESQSGTPSMSHST